MQSFLFPFLIMRPYKQCGKVPVLLSHRYKYAEPTYIIHPSAFNKINLIKIGFMPNYKIHMLQKQKTHLIHT